MFIKSGLLYDAYKDLKKNKMRSGLTTLGILIGVASVVAISGLTESSRIVIRGKLFSYGKNAVRFNAGHLQWAEEKDLINIMNENPSITAISPFFDENIYNVEGFGNRLQKSRLQALNNNYFYIKEMKLFRGRLFSSTEQITSAKVVIIGNTVKEALFGEMNPIGQEIYLNKITFKIIGLIESSGTSIGGKDFDNFVSIPYGALRHLKKEKMLVEQIYISTKEKQQTEEVKAKVIKYFRSKFNILPGNDDSQRFEVSTSDDKLEIANYIMRALRWLMLIVSGIALIVGGIGIMNIMLASVNERIREIGIRMAIGAKKRDILLQFLSESVLLSVIGGSIGTIIGFSIYLTIVLILGWPVVFSISSIFVSYLFSAGVGIFFGFYPAKKASDMLPINALRHV